MKAGEKDFRQRIRLENGSFNWKVSDALGAKAKTLYRLPELLAGIKAGKTIYLNEGEKACDELAKAGLVATCQPGGANKESPETSWLPQHTDVLRGARVVIVADRDETGEIYARYVASALKRVAEKVMVVQSRTEGAKDDAYDHFRAGHGPEAFVPRPDLSGSRAIAGVSFSNDNFEPAVIEYLWKPRLPRGKIILFDADGGTGKTAVLAAIAAGLSIGQLPCGDGEVEPVRTAYFHKGEDDDREIATVAHACGADLSKIRFIAEPDLSLTEEGIAMIEDTIEDTGAQFVVFDALLYFFLGTGLRDDAWKSPIAVMPALQGLTQIARRTGCTIVNVRHTSKGVPGKAASELGFGTVQFRNSHRGQLVARAHPEERGVVVVTDEKGSLLVERGDPFGYRRRGNAIEYLAEVDDPFNRPRKSGRPTKIEDAIDFIKRFRAEGKYIHAPEIEGPALQEGFSHALLAMAKKQLGIVSRKNIMGDGRWHWVLPDDWPTKEEVFDPYADE